MRDMLQRGYEAGKQIGIGGSRARNNWYGGNDVPNTGNYLPGAAVGRVRSDWPVAIMTSTTMLRLAFRTLCARSERAFRIDPYTSRAASIVKTFSVGSGIIPIPRIKNSNGTLAHELNKKIADHWQRFNEQGMRQGGQPLSMLEAQGIEFESMCILGSVLRQTVISRPGSWLPFAFSWVKPYRLNFAFDNYFDDLWYRMIIGQGGRGNAPDNIDSGALIILGQIFNKFMEPEGFYILGEDKPVPASQMSIHYRQREPEQYLGMPIAMIGLEDTFDIQELWTDKLAQSRFLTRMGVYFDKNDKLSFVSDLSTGGYGSDGAESVGLPGLTGTFAEKKPEPILFDDKISASLEPLMLMALHRIAISWGISYQLLSSDLRGASFSGGRINNITDSKVLKAVLGSFIGSNAQPSFNKFMEWEILAGKLPEIGYNEFMRDQFPYTRTYWLPEKTDWFDPKDQIQAQRLQLQTGTITLQELCEENGRNYEDVIMQRSNEKDFIKEYNLGELLCAYSERTTPADIMAIDPAAAKDLPGTNGGSDNGK